RAAHLESDAELIGPLPLLEGRPWTLGLLVRLLEFLLSPGPIREVLLPRLAGDRAHEHRADGAVRHDAAHELVGDLRAVDHLRMLDAVDAGVERHAQSFAAGGVSLDHLPARVRALDDRPLRLGGEADERRLREMARAAVLDEVRAPVEIGV